MRVWLIDDRRSNDPRSLEPLLRQLGEHSHDGLVLLGARSFWPQFVEELRATSTSLDLLVVHEPAWPDGSWMHDVLALGIGLIVETSLERSDRFLPLADLHPVVFLAPNPSLDALRLALRTAHAARRCREHWKSQVTRLQQRLSDRVVIERAKGILVQRLNISEEEAYKRLRLLSRRQRRQIRDIAQSLLDTQCLLSPSNNGFGEHPSLELSGGGDQPSS